MDFFVLSLAARCSSISSFFPSPLYFELVYMITFYLLDIFVYFGLGTRHVPLLP